MVFRNESADYVNGFELLVGQRGDKQLCNVLRRIVSKIRRPAYRSDENHPAIHRRY